MRVGRKRSKIQKASTGIQRTTGVGIMKRVLLFEDGKGKVEWEKHNHCIERGDGEEMKRK